MKKILVALTLVSALAGVAGTAVAADSKTKVDAPRDQWMSTQQITDKLTAEGLQVRRVKEENGVYEVYALDTHGKRIEALVNPVTGEMMGADKDD